MTKPTAATWSIEISKGFKRKTNFQPLTLIKKSQFNQDKMPAGKIVGRVFFARDQLLGMEKLTVRASANLIYDSRLLSTWECSGSASRPQATQTEKIVVDVRMLTAPKKKSTSGCSKHASNHQGLR